MEKPYFLTNRYYIKPAQVKAKQNSYEIPSLLTAKPWSATKVMDAFAGMKDLSRAMESLRLCSSLADPAQQLLWLSPSSLFATSLGSKISFT